MATSSKVGVWNRALHAIGETDLVLSEDEARPAAEACALLYDDVLREALEAHPWRWAMREKALTAIDTQTQTTVYADGVDPWDTWDIPFPYVNASQLEVVHISATAVETVLVADTDYTIDANGDIVLTAALVAGESIKVTVTTTRSGWDHLYPLPADCVTPIALVASEDSTAGADGAMYLDTDASTATGADYESTPVAARQPFEVVLNDAAEGLLLCTNADEGEFLLLYVALVETVTVWPKVFLDAVVWRLAAGLALSLKKDPGLAGGLMKTYAMALDRAACLAENVGQRGPGAMTPTYSARG